MFQAEGIGQTTGYVIGAIIALAILFYLIYSLIRPEKF
jgi:K+-transporting ATPase KdpF subunit